MDFETSIDDLDLLLLEQLQQDSGLSNLALSQRVHASPATCLRRVKRLQTLGLIERQIAVLNPERLAQALGHGVTALVEVSLDRQDSASMEVFEALAVAQPEVQQCYRVSPGPDFCLVVHASDMPAYLALSQRLFIAQANVRNVRAFFSMRRAKFGAALALPAGTRALAASTASQPKRLKLKTGA